MKKRILFLVVLIAGMLSVLAQSDEQKVAQASEALRKALVDADKTALEALTAEQLSYGHSSGKVENKSEFIDAVLHGPVDFVSIDITGETIRLAGDAAVVRHLFYTKMKRDGKDDEIRISVLQVWQKRKGTWKLLARQAVKVS